MVKEKQVKNESENAENIQCHQKTPMNNKKKFKYNITLRNKETTCCKF